MILSIINIVMSFYSILTNFAYLISWIVVILLFMLNSCLLFILSTNKKLKEYFVFECECKWLNPNTLFIPFEFNVCLCNYFILKIAIFGHGVDLRIKWRDVVKQTMLEESVKIPEKIKII